MPLILGTEPDRLDVVLTLDGDFVETVETMTPDQMYPQPWPIGTTLTLVFGTPTQTQVSWPATVQSNIVSWVVQSTAVNAVIDAKLRTVKLWYENGPIRYPLASGEVTVFG